MTTADALATVGVGLLLFAFLANLLGAMRSKGKAYLALNLLGAGMAGAAAVIIQFWPFVVLEGVWATVAAVGLFRGKTAAAAHGAAEPRRTS
ncbi:MAG: hypothetical protein DWG83_00655 [Chloroflexi bacterium]|nr:hypothetical protein [Chloroflexota bacterium]MDA1240260.1 hypothetical protein [Chloroflexota bacterium]MQC19070.1 hypothetical protein [Chloroflexota bacterium]